MIARIAILLILSAPCSVAFGQSAPVDSSRLAYQQQIVAGMSLDVGVRSAPHERVRAADFLEAQFSEFGLEPQRHDYRLANVNGLVDLLLPPYKGSNIFTVLEATRSSAPYVVVGAHYDSDPGSPGAGDNAAGVAVVLTLAQHLSQLEDRAVHFILVGFDQEEDDEVGSRAFAKHLQKCYPNVHSVHVTDLSGWDDDMDRVIEIQSPGPMLERLYRTAADRQGLQIRITEGQSSDNKSFLQAGMAVVGVFGDITTDLHKPTDTYDTVDFEFMDMLTRLMTDALSQLAVDGGSNAH